MRIQILILRFKGSSVVNSLWFAVIIIFAGDDLIILSFFLQVESELDKKLPLLDVVNSFPSWSASRLSAILLPPLPPVVPLSSRPRSRARTTPLPKSTAFVKKGPKRPSLRFVELLCCVQIYESVFT